jgi:hypothetical protein
MIGEDAERVAQFAGRGNEAFMRMSGGHCAALSVRQVAAGDGAGENAEGETEFFCTIYERRPQICRDLARGSPECAGERAIKVGACH